MTLVESQWRSKGYAKSRNDAPSLGSAQRSRTPPCGRASRAVGAADLRTAELAGSRAPGSQSRLPEPSPELCAALCGVTSPGTSSASPVLSSGVFCLLTVWFCLQNASRQEESIPLDHLHHLAVPGASQPPALPPGCGEAVVLPRPAHSHPLSTNVDLRLSPRRRS